MDIPICNVLKFTATALQKINDKKFPVQSDECLLRRISPLYSQCTRSASDGRLCCLYSREQINFLVACFFWKICLLFVKNVILHRLFPWLRMFHHHRHKIERQKVIRKWVLYYCLVSDIILPLDVSFKGLTTSGSIIKWSVFVL